MTEGQDPAARVVCVVDNDFGELVFAMYFLEGQPFAARTTLLLPPRLAERNDGRLPVATRPFSSAQDILRAVDVEKPAAVVLCSGYLLAIHGILRRTDLPELVERLRTRCRVVTSDPFLGLVSEGKLTDKFGITVPWIWPLGPLMERVLSRKLIQHLSTARQALEQATHLYGFPFSGTEDPHRATRTERISFYNPEFGRRDGDGGRDPEASGPPEWLFILGSEDWKVQTMEHGDRQFNILVARKLEETVDAGRTPILVGPAQLLEEVRPRLSRPDRVRLLSFMPYSSFTALMRSAEYVFYWNVFSSSSTLRLIHDRPFFLFHEGHLVHNVKGLRERLRDWYYQGWEPPLLDQMKRLDPDRLDALADDFREASFRIRTALARSPTPVAVLETLLGSVRRTP